MKGFDLRSSAVNLRAPGSSHRPGIKSKSRTTSFYLDIRVVLLLQRQREMMSLCKLHNTIQDWWSLLQISLFLIECDVYLSFSLWLEVVSQQYPTTLLEFSSYSDMIHLFQISISWKVWDKLIWNQTQVSNLITPTGPTTISQNDTGYQ